MADKFVVRIESTSMIFNWTHPYKTPSFSKETGSGTIIDNKGNILTCAHVVENATSLRVSLPSESQEKFIGKIVSCCPSRDLAIINVKQFSGRSGIKFGDSEKIKIGDIIKVLGYPLSQNKPMLTAGIMGGSLNGRFQIDAQINPGNSGGPLLDKNNKMIGVVDSVIFAANPSIKSAPISRSIPLFAFQSLQKMALSGKHKLLHNPQLGIIYSGGSSKAMLDYLEKNEKKVSGALVRFIFPHSMLQKQGVEEGDVITKFNRNQVDNFGECKLKDSTILMDNLMDHYFWNDKIEVDIWRPKTNKRQNIVFKLNKMRPLLGIRTMYPALEKVDYICFQGMIIMELSVNHLGMLEMLPWSRLAKMRLNNYKLVRNRSEKVLLVTQILPESPVALFDTIQEGALLEEINQQKVHTLIEMRNAIKGEHKVLIKTKFGSYFSADINSKTKKIEQKMAGLFKYPMEKVPIL